MSGFDFELIQIDFFIRGLWTWSLCAPVNKWWFRMRPYIGNGFPAIRENPRLCYGWW